MKHIDIVKLYNDPAYIGQQVTVCGWVRTSRDSKNVAFLEMNDGTSLKHLQIVLDKEAMGDVSAYMPLGTSLKVEGTLVSSERNGVEVNATAVEVLGACPGEYPLQKKRCTLEFLRTIPQLRYDTSRPEDLDTAGEDHIADEWRYLCMARPIRPIRELPQKTLLSDPLGRF